MEKLNISTKHILLPSFFVICLSFVLPNNVLNFPKNDKFSLKRNINSKKTISFESLILFLIFILFFLFIVFLFLRMLLKKYYSAGFILDENNLIDIKDEDKIVVNKKIGIINEIPQVIVATKTKVKKDYHFKTYPIDEVVERMTIFNDDDNTDNKGNNVIFILNINEDNPNIADFKPLSATFKHSDDEYDVGKQLIYSACKYYTSNNPTENLRSRKDGKNGINYLSIQAFVELVNNFFCKLFLENKDVPDKLVKDNVEKFLTYILCSVLQQTYYMTHHFFQLHDDSAKKSREIYLNIKKNYQKAINETKQQLKIEKLSKDDIKKDVIPYLQKEFLRRQKFHWFKTIKKIEIDFSKIQKEFNYFSIFFQNLLKLQNVINNAPALPPKENQVQIDAFYTKKIKEEEKK